MQTDKDNPRRKTLRFITQLMFLAGFVLLAIPFFSGETTVKTDTQDINVSHLQEGETMNVLWGSKPVFILKRSAAMLESLRQPNDTLNDPWSKRPQQPAAAKNVYRSVKPGFFVSFLGCEGGGYPLIYSDGLKDDGYPKDVLVCTKAESIYDLAGRVYTGMPDKKNLPVPIYSFPEEGIIRLGEE